MRAGWSVLAALFLAVVPGCGNPCPAVCDEMANFARDCGYTVTDAEIEECMEDQSSPTADERDVCRQFGDRAFLRATWDCIEIGRYYEDQTPAFAR